MTAEGKKLLMLGASMQQIPAIEEAKRQGHYVITCDYLPENPGHALADESHDVSTTDREAVLALARRVGIDGILAYASDPAAPTAAYVAEALGLPGNPLRSVETLCRKDLFRAFLRDNGFNCPRAESYATAAEARAGIGGFGLPVMVKPVDSSGSKGVVKVEDPSQAGAAIEEAFSYSRAGRVVVEEFIVKEGYQVSGDGFSVDGELVFTSFGNELYSDGGSGVRDYVALGEFWPSLLTAEQKRAVDAELQGIMTALGMGTCAYNVEAIIDAAGDVYVVELAPRNGGSYIPQLIRYATGVDLVGYAVKAAVGDGCGDLRMAPSEGFYSNYMIMAGEAGSFGGLWFAPGFEGRNLLEVHCTASPGDRVEAYRNTTHSLGTVLFKAGSLEEMLEITGDFDSYCRVLVG